MEKLGKIKSIPPSPHRPDSTVAPFMNREKASSWFRSLLVKENVYARNPAISDAARGTAFSRIRDRSHAAARSTSRDLFVSFMVKTSLP